MSTEYKIAFQMSLDTRSVTSGVAVSTTQMGKLGEAAAVVGNRVSASVGDMSEAFSVVGNKAAALHNQLGQISTQSGGAFSQVAGSANQAATQVATATRAMDAGVQRVGVSAKQTAAALRGLPAQMTDIFTGLASGQSPLTVLIQQGGQLKDMFGGVGNAARAIGGYLAGLLSPLTLVLGAVALVAGGFLAGQQQSKDFSNAIILSGNAAGKTMAQYEGMSSAVAGLARVSKGAAMEGLAEMATRGQVAGDSLERMTALAVRFEKVGGPAVGKTAEAFASLAEKPAAASEKLNQAYNYLEPAVYRRIKALEDEGRQTEAAALAQEAYANALATRIPQMEANVGLLERAWNGVKGAITGAWDALASIGRVDTLAQQRTAIEGAIGSYQRIADFGGLVGQAAAKKVESLKQELAYLGESARMEKRSAEAAAQRTEQTRATGEWERLVTNNLGQQQKLAQEIERIRSTGAAAKIDPAEIERLVGAARQRFYNGDGLNAETEKIKQALQQREALTRDAVETINSLYKQQAITQVEQINRVADAERGQLQASMAALQQEIAIAGKKKDGAKELAQLKGELAQKGLELDLREQKRQRDLAELEVAQTKRLQDKTAEWALEGAAAEKALALELAMYGQVGEARAVAAAALKLEADAEKLIADAKRAGQPLSDKAAAQLRAEAQARGLNASAMQAERQALAGAEQLRQENRRFAAESILDAEQRARALLEIDAESWRARIALAGEGTEAQKKLAAEFDEWYRNQLQRPMVDKARAFVEGMESSFKAGFTRLLEGGRDKWSAFTTSLKNAFKTEVADQIYKFLAKPFVVKLAASLFGLDSTTAGGGGGLLGTLGTAGNLANLGSTIMGGIQSGFAGVTGAIANVLGGTTASNAALATTLTGDIASAQAAAVAAAEAAGAASAAATSAASLGSSIASAAPYVAAAVVAYQVADKLFGSKGGPKTESGYGPGIAARGDPASARAISEQIQGAYTQLATTLGLAVKDLQVGVFSAIDAAGDSLTQLQVVAVQQGERIYDRLQRLGSFENVGRSAEEYSAAVAEETARVLASVLERSELPQKFKDFLAQATDLPGAVQIVAQVAQIDRQFVALGGPLGQVADLSVEAQLAFARAAGGMENVLGFQQAFYSESERTAAATQLLQQQFAALGQTMPASREELRGVIGQLIAMGNVELAGKLVALQGAFNAVVPAVESATAAVRQLVSVGDVFSALDGVADRLLDSAQARAYKIARIQQQLAEQGFTVSAEAIANASAESLAAVFSTLQLGTNDGRRAALALANVTSAILDLNAGAQTAAAGVRSAADILSERQGLESQLYQLLGNTAVLRQREMDALDPSNRGLQRHINAVQDATDAVEAANTAYEQARQGAQQAASAIEQQASAQRQVVSELQQDMQKWVNLRKQAGSLLGQINTSLGGSTADQEAGLWAQLSGGADIEAQLQAAQELYGLITQKATVETQAAQQGLQNAQQLLDVGKELRNYVSNLRTGDLTALTPAQALAEARAQFEATTARADAGDMDARRQVQQVTDTYLRLAQQFSPGSYSTVFAEVTNRVDQLATSFVSEAEQQIELQQALVDAAGTANGLSADQLARLQQLQGAVQSLYSRADSNATTTNAQLFIANANLDGLEQQLAAAKYAVDHVASGVDAAKEALRQAQADAAEYLASQQAQMASADPTPALLANLPANIAAALAPLINGAATGMGGAGGFDPGRAQIIRNFALSLPQDESGIYQLISRAIELNVSSAELEAALAPIYNLAPGSITAWAVSHGLPSFDVGTNRVPRDMLAQIHEGERIVPEADNRRLFQLLERTPDAPVAPVAAVGPGQGAGGDGQAVVRELVALRRVLERTLDGQGRTAHEAQATMVRAVGDALERGISRLRREDTVGRRREVASA